MTWLSGIEDPWRDIGCSIPVGVWDDWPNSIKQGFRGVMGIEVELCKDLPPDERPVEIVERKGTGHPDTICDLVSERFSVTLSNHYLENYGLILHHNVDKALLSAGRSKAGFGGGHIDKPIDLYLSGRATDEVEGRKVPVRELAETAIAQWFGHNLHAFDPGVGLRLHCITEPGSPELVGLFMRQKEQGVFLANDTSCGVGFAPLSELERIVLAVERGLNRRDFKEHHPETGEDIKVMGVRVRDRISLTVSCAFIGRFLADLAAYRAARDALAWHVYEAARAMTARELDVHVNAGDDLEAGSIYLTVSETSAEAGDDGETGRGNRMNGLITPFRPMCLEAMAGKNPVTHVGKLYTAAANRIAQAICSEISGVRDAECFLVSSIGSPIEQPRLAHIAIRSLESRMAPETAMAVEGIALREIARIPTLWRDFLAGTLSVA
jgi:S-adenosylmethionine synthetase